MVVLTSLEALVTISVEPIPPGRVAPVIIRFTILLMITMPKKDNTEPMTLWVLNWLPRQMANISSPVEKQKKSTKRDSRYIILFTTFEKPLRELRVFHISRNT